MATPASDLLTLTQWLSPAFPIGAFAYSHGLETAVATGDVTSAKDLEGWLAQILTRGAGLTDAVLLHRALDLAADFDQLAAEAQARAGSRERWVETFEQGRAFTETVNALTGRGDVPMALPVAVGRAAQDLTLPAKDVVAVYLQSFLGNLVSAAIRLVPLGQTEGQGTLRSLQPAILDVAARSADLSLYDVRSAAFGAELAAMCHETLDVRIFKT